MVLLRDDLAVVDSMEFLNLLLQYFMALLLE